MEGTMKKVIEANNSLLIKNSILILFVLLNAVFFFISYITNNNRFEVMLSQSMNQQLEVVEDFFRYPENIINILSQNEDLSMYESEKGDRFYRSKILSLFESVIVPDSRISNIYFVPKEKEVISYKFIEPGINLTNRNWFSETLERKTQYNWVSHKSEFSSENVISCLRKVVDKYGKPIGVVGLDIELFKLSELVRDKKIGNSGYFMILDDKNKIIATPHYNYLGQVISDSNLDNTDYSYTKSFTLNIFGCKSKCIIYQLEELPWKIVSVIPKSEITHGIVISSLLFFMFSMASLIIAFIMYSKNKITEIANRELKIANEKLKEYASTVEENAVLKERNRLARDVHDTLGYTLIALIKLISESISLCRVDVVETEKRLNNALKTTKDGLKEVRRSLYGLIPQELEQNSLFDALEKLVNNFEHLGVKVELSVNKLEENIGMEYKEVIYRVCQEALTNSVKHGKASEVNIVIKFTDTHIKLFIFDNGIGCDKKRKGKGFGLQGMRQRIEKLNGEIQYGSGDGEGFNIHIELPLNKTEMGDENIYDKSCVGR